MTRFVCITQHSDTLGIRGPSGFTYSSVQGLAFEVKEQLDIDYFKKQPKRFKIETIVERVAKKVVPTKPTASATGQEEKELEEFMEQASISKAGKEKIKKFYGSVNGLHAEHIAGQTFRILHQRDSKRLLIALEQQND